MHILDAECNCQVLRPKIITVIIFECHVPILYVGPFQNCIVLLLLLTTLF